MELTKKELELKDKWVREEHYQKMGQKTTVCVLVLSNGFELVGTSAPVNPLFYERELGEKCALKHAITKLYELNGFAEQEEATSDQGNIGQE